MFSSKCYQVDVILRVRQRFMRLATTIFETGAGPNLINEDVIPLDGHTRIKTFKTSLRSAGDTTFSVNRVLRLQSDICADIYLIIFGIAPVLATETILETTFIKERMKRIETLRRLIVPRRRTSMLILASPSKNVTSHLGKAVKLDVNRRIRAVPRAKTVSPYSQDTNLMRTKRLGTYIRQPVELTETRT